MKTRRDFILSALAIAGCGGAATVKPMRRYPNLPPWLPITRAQYDRLLLASWKAVPFYSDGRKPAEPVHFEHTGPVTWRNEV